MESKYRGRLLALKQVRSIAQGFFVVSRKVATSLLLQCATKTLEFRMSKRTPLSVAIPDQCPDPKRLVNASAAADRSSAIFNTSLSAASLSFIRISRRTLSMIRVGVGAAPGSQQMGHVARHRGRMRSDISE
jgi:hypothetical protein